MSTMKTCICRLGPRAIEQGRRRGHRTRKGKGAQDKRGKGGHRTRKGKGVHDKKQAQNTAQCTRGAADTVEGMCNVNCFSLSQQSISSLVFLPSPV